jgi:D-alanine-D-alanine ligase
MNFEHVGVISGGWGEEREISLKTGAAVAAALETRGYTVTQIVAGPGFDRALREADIDVAFLALHGRMGEDGKVQGLLEVMGIPYTGSGVLASALAMNKPFAKKLFRQHNLATPSGYTVRSNQLSELETLHCDLSFPCVVKPASGGSSVGMSFVADLPSLAPAVARACRYGGEALIERYIKGREVTVAILGGEVLGSCEISSSRSLFDYEAKYGSESVTKYHLPPRLPPTRVQNIEAMALTAYRALGCRGAARVDFVCPEVGNEVLLEVNTIPGMTPTSLLPKIAQRSEISFSSLCVHMLELAGCEAVEAIKEGEMALDARSTPRAIDANSSSGG